jgi:hypothetical protein
MIFRERGEAHVDNALKIVAENQFKMPPTIVVFVPGPAPVSSRPGPSKQPARI